MLGGGADKNKCPISFSAPPIFFLALPQLICVSNEITSWKMIEEQKMRNEIIISTF